MRSISLLALCVLICSFSGKQFHNSLSEQNLKGKVKSVTRYLYSAKKENKDYFFKWVSSFDESGNQIFDKLLARFSDTDSMVRYEYTMKNQYDNENNKMMTAIYNKLDILVAVTVHKHAADWVQSSAATVTFKTNGDTVNKTLIQYNAGNNTATEIGLDKNNNVEYTNAFEYDSRGLLKEEKLYGKDPKTPDRITKYTYDKKGNIIETVIFDPATPTAPETRVSCHIIASDKKGNWTRQTEITERKGKKTDTVLYVRDIAYY